MSCDDQGSPDSCDNGGDSYFYNGVNSKSSTSDRAKSLFYLINPPKSIRRINPLSVAGVLTSVSRLWLTVFLVDHLALLNLGHGNIFRLSLVLAAITIALESIVNTRLLSNCVAVFFWVAIPQLMILVLRGTEMGLIHLGVIVGVTAGLASVVTGLICSDVW